MTGISKFLKRGVLVAATGVGIGADADVAVRYRLLRRPFAHRLREQRNRRHQIEHPPADTGDRFGDTQRGEGLARAAGHDELAAVVPLEAVDHVVERGALVRAQAVGFAPEGQVFRLAANEVRPVERAARQIAEAQHGTRRLERRDGLDGVRTPPVAGIDDDAGGEGVASGSGDERVEVGLRYSGAGGVALALDGADAAAALLGHEIDAGVGAAEAGPRTRPFGPQAGRRRTAPRRAGPRRSTFSSAVRRDAPSRLPTRRWTGCGPTFSETRRPGSTFPDLPRRKPLDDPHT